MQARCAARSKRTGNGCGNFAMLGQEVCRMHGGKSPQALRRAALRVVEQEAAAAVSKFGARRPVSDPLTALGEVAGEMVAVKDWLREQVERIDTDMRTLDDKSAEQMRAEFTAYTGMLNSTVAALATIAKLNIDERLVRIDELRAGMIKEALRRAFVELGLTGEAQTRGLATFSRHLRVVGS